MKDFIKEYWLQTLFTCIVGVATFILRSIYKDLKKSFNDNKTMKQGLVALLHNSLFRNCSAYISEGEITVDELDNLEELYESYHSLGGNGTGTALYERCKNLKIKQ